MSYGSVKKSLSSKQVGAIKEKMQHGVTSPGVGRIMSQEHGVSQAPTTRLPTPSATPRSDISVATGHTNIRNPSTHAAKMQHG